MNSIERFLKTLAREPVDRPAVWLGLPEAGSLPGLYKYFGVSDTDGLKRKLDDDLWSVELPYSSPYSNRIYDAFPFAKAAEGRTLTKPGFFEDCDDPSEVDSFDWPVPERYISPKQCAKAVERVPEGKAVLGVIWSAHFQDACAAFGMENALCVMLTNPEMYEAVNAKIVDFYLRANEIFYQNTAGRLHAVLIGNDMGSQTGLMLSPNLIRRHVLPGARKLIEQAHSYGVKVIYHSCGAVSAIFNDLIDIGADALHPMQALAAGMNPERLKRDFGGRAAFCGGVDTQELLVNGTPEEVAAKVRELRNLFPTGLVISPSHEAILPDVSPANVEALFRAASAA